MGLLSEIRSCTRCSTDLPLGVKSLAQFNTSSKTLIIGQAPGRKTHEAGTPWLDASGNRLRDWLGVKGTVFYDSSAFAHVPMDFCYPGTGKGGHLPPRVECAATWYQRILDSLSKIALTIYIGQYSQRYYLPQTKQLSLAQRVQRWQDFWPSAIPLPHPSPRNQRCIKQNPWFEEAVLPALRRRIQQVLA